RNVAGEFVEFDLATPALDVATVQVKGKTVPYVVRVETGVINRGVYRIAAIVDPADPNWTPWDPQPTWSRKLVFMYGGGCGFGHTMGMISTDPLVDVGYSSPPILADLPLSMGYAVASSSKMAMGNDCNATISDETSVMLKEHFIERYGVPTFTMGHGGSGGSLTQMDLATRYPGILDGLNRQRPFQDLNSLIFQTQIDCDLLKPYFAQNSDGWTTAQVNAVQGRDKMYCDAQRATSGTFSPTNCASIVPSDVEYHPVTNPGGLRCSLPDTSANVLGLRDESVWSEQERVAGRGFANRYADNTGVEYGRKALDDGVISIHQFLDLNAKVGGFDLDWNRVGARLEADSDAVRRAYANGLVPDMAGLDALPIIDTVTTDPVAANSHEQMFPYVVRERLTIANGHADNHVVFRVSTSAATTIGHVPTDDAFRAMDAWLTGIAADKSNRSAAEKVKAHRAEQLSDRCYDVANQQQPMVACDTAYPLQTFPRTAAGQPFTSDVVKCSLKEPSRTEYVGMTDEQWERLLAIFPAGVCDYSERGEYRVPFTGPWLTFEDGPDGRPLAGDEG
ncbi:MAG TPA: DUF6351 family protein, partial [Microbacterium sp.]|uniref:DUF6351 family protein n=1 Tax=Microbacterium sp. TaxID=51671 RepID=UPI002B9E24A7